MPLPLADAIFWVAAVCCAVAQLVILRGTLTAPAAPSAGDAVPAARRPAEIVWAVIPAVALVVVLAATWRVLHPPPASAPQPAPEHTAALGGGVRT